MDNTQKHINEPFNVYCNGIEIGMSPFDLSFWFNNNSKDGMNFIGEIKMSPEHAKVFAHMLMEHISQYEAMFGPIPDMHPERLERLRSEGKIVVDRNPE